MTAIIPIRKQLRFWRKIMKWKLQEILMVTTGHNCFLSIKRRMQFSVGMYAPTESSKLVLWTI